MSDSVSYLDTIRTRHGNDKCRQDFIHICAGNRHKAAELINDIKLTFPCFYILMPAIKTFKLYNN